MTHRLWNQNFHNRCIPNMQRSTDPTLCNNYLLDTQLDTKTKCKMNGKNSNQGPKKNVHRPLQSLEKYCWRPLKILEWNLALWKRNTKNLCTVLYMQVKNPGNVKLKPMHTKLRDTSVLQERCSRSGTKPKPRTIWLQRCSRTQPVRAWRWHTDGYEVNCRNMFFQIASLFYLHI